MHRLLMLAFLMTSSIPALGGIDAFDKLCAHAVEARHITSWGDPESKTCETKSPACGYVIRCDDGTQHRHLGPAPPTLFGHDPSTLLIFFLSAALLIGIFYVNRRSLSFATSAQKNPLVAPPAVEAMFDVAAKVSHFFNDTIVSPLKSSAPPDPNYVPPPSPPPRNSAHSEPSNAISQPSSFVENTAPSQQSLSQRSVQQQPVQPFSDNGPVKGMALKLNRGQRPGALGRVIFTLDARIDVSADNRALITKYKLGNRIIYDSANRRAYTDATMDHLEKSRDNTSIFDSPGRQAWGAGKTFFRLGRAAISATAAALSLRITVNSLMKGVHVECKDMVELLEAEAAIVEAGQNLKAEIDAATTFTGQEHVIDL